MKVREPLYRQVADIVITTDKRSTRCVVKDILRMLSEL